MKVSGGIVCSGVIDGADGYSSAVVQLFRRSATALGNGDRPTGTLTYTFATGVLSGTASYFNGWSQSMPQAIEGTKLYVTMATARSQGATDTIAASEWSTPVEYVADGMKYASVIIYKRSASQPTDKPANGAVYTFATGGLTGTLNGWSTAIPATNANHDPCWVRHATAVSSGTTDTIAASEWSDPAVKLVEDGAGGAVATVTPGELSIPCDKNGNVLSQVSQVCTFGITLGGVDCKGSDSNNPTQPTASLKSKPDKVTVTSSQGGKQMTVTVPVTSSGSAVKDTDFAQGVVFTVTGKDANDKTVTADCTLGLKGQRQGQQGGKGDDAVTYDLIFDSYQASYNAQTTAFSLSAHVRVLKTEGSSTSYVHEDAYTPEYKLSNNDSWYAMTKAQSDFTCSVSAPSMATAPVSVNFRLMNGGTVLCAVSMPITVKGEKGSTGPMCYIAGTCREGVEYKSNDRQTVAVEVQAASGTETEIYYLDAATNKVTVGGQTVYLTPENQSRYGYDVWKRGLNEYNLVRTKYLFADFAKLGEGVVSGDWLFSANGYIESNAYNDGQTYGWTGITGYMFFDPASPNECVRKITRHGSYYTFSPGYRIVRVYGTAGAWVSFRQNGVTKDICRSDSSSWTESVVIGSGGGVDFVVDVDEAGSSLCQISITGGSIEEVQCVSFAPNYAVDLLTGKSYQNDAYVRGQIVATSGTFTGTVNATGGSITGTMTVGTYGSGQNCILINPSDTNGAGISGYSGTKRMFRLGFNENDKGFLSMNNCYMQDDALFLQDTEGNSVSLVTSPGSVAGAKTYIYLARYVGGSEKNVHIGIDSSGNCIIKTNCLPTSPGNIEKGTLYAGSDGIVRIKTY